MATLKEHFKILATKRKEYFDGLIADTGLALAEIEILVFIYRNPSDNTFTKIQESKNYAKSYVSTSIKRLIENGYITRHYAEGSKKVFRLTPLEKSHSIASRYDQCEKAFAQDLFDGISKEEYETFISVIEKVSYNMQNKRAISV